MSRLSRASLVVSVRRSTARRLAAWALCFRQSPLFFEKFLFIYLFIISDNRVKNRGKMEADRQRGQGRRD
jgi:hypothetical protein